MDLETLEDIEDTDNAFEKIELNELKAQIQYAINTLPDYQKEVIILRFYYDLKIREIATITKASVSTVKSRLQQGIKKLERYLADFRGGDSISAAFFLDCSNNTHYMCSIISMYPGPMEGSILLSIDNPCSYGSIPCVIRCNRNI